MGPAPAPFAPWGPDHLAVLVLTAAASAALAAGRDRLRGRDDRRIRRAAAVALAANDLAAWLIAAAQGTFRVPLQLCDLTLVLMVWALWSARPVPATLAYFWALAGSLQAVLTPDLAWGFPDYWWVKFFISHCGMVLSAVYLAATGRVAASHGWVWRAFALVNAYAASAGLVNWLFGTNLGYLARKPAQPSLLDWFGPWPWYILVMEAAALASFYAWYAPFALARHRAVRRIG